MKRLRNPQAGFSIIDMVMGLSMIAIAILAIQTAQSNYVTQSTQVEIGLRAVSLGNSFQWRDCGDWGKDNHPHSRNRNGP